MLARPTTSINILSLIVTLCCGAVNAQSSNRPRSRQEAHVVSQTETDRRGIKQRKTEADALLVADVFGDFRSAFSSGNYEEAFLSLADKAGHLYDQNQFPAAMQVYRAFSNFADPFTTIDPSDAEEELIRKSTIIKDMSRNYVKFMINTHLVHPDLCRTNDCLNLGWDMTEKIKSRLLRVQLINGALSRLDTQERQTVRNLMDQVKQERIARNKLRLETGNLVSRTDRDANILAMDAEIAKHLPEYTTLASEIASPRKIREVLADDETFLSFVYTNNRRYVYVWKLQRDDSLNSPPKPIKTKMLTEDLFAAVETTRENIVKGAAVADLSEVLGTIYRDVIEPLGLSAHRRLIIAADQNLSALPFDLIPWGNDQKMMDVFDITYVPSATIFYHLRENRHKGIPRAYQLDYAGFGYGGTESGGLIHTETEIENASQFLARKVRLPNATEAGIYRNAADIAKARYLHFATHNYLVEGVDASFYLLFGVGDGEDGRLTSREILSRLRNHAELAVLSSCETAPANDNYSIGQSTQIDPRNARGGYTRYVLSGCVCSYGESFSNLTGAFFAAGSKQLLLTQWRIRDDAKTDIFISRFFRFLSEGKTPTEALKEAKRKMRNQDPVLWAGFILAGD